MPDDAPTSMTIELTSEEATDRLGAALARVLPRNAVVGLVGPLGAGKTRLARAIAAGLGIDPESVSSPTYVLIHEYEGERPVYHFDAYRLDGLRSFAALGVEEYWEAGGVCLVEWADRVADLLPESTLWIEIEPTGPASRRVLLRGRDVSRLGALLKKMDRGV
jgi:tRNA threonylcarbamoyladenosine biosynthesis protein TsaE